MTEVPVVLTTANLCKNDFMDQTRYISRRAQIQQYGIRRRQIKPRKTLCKFTAALCRRPTLVRAVFELLQVTGALKIQLCHRNMCDPKQNPESEAALSTGSPPCTPSLSGLPGSHEAISASCFHTKA